MKLGDFSSLANAYSESRPSYSENVLQQIFEEMNFPSSDLHVADIGAGTGIWTRMLSKVTTNEITAVEPNKEMMDQGAGDSKGYNIRWVQGAAEQIPLEQGSKNWITMASSFHWAEFGTALTEFRRVLQPGGYFTAVWNPRYFESNPKLVQIENWLNQNIDSPRVSSGRSGITSTLTERLSESSFVQKVTYREDKHTQAMSRETYITAWKSTNDVQVKLGSVKFNEFLKLIEQIFEPNELISTEYLTRSWTAKFN
jgi:ubiquinone/menaquinone biosynthesis C-methylase UbiE